MFWSEELINAYVPETVVAEYTTYGQYNLIIRIAGIYRIVCVGAGGLSTGIYGGDATGNGGHGWTGFSVSTGGCGAVVSTDIFLKPDQYLVTVGALGGGTDLNGGSYRSVKTPGSSQGALPISTYIRNSANEVLLSAGGGGPASYYDYRGNQKNDGARYTYNQYVAGGAGTVNVTPNWNTSIIKGASAAISNGGDNQAWASRSASYTKDGVGYGKPHDVHGWYASTLNYTMSYDVYSGTGGYCCITYLRSNA